MSDYRWNTSAAAEAYDQAAAVIHPHYHAVQDALLAALPFEPLDDFLLVDLGAGSGRFVQRFLERFTSARAAIVDQSEAFLAIAERRLTPQSERVTIVQSRLQDDWKNKLPAPPQAIVQYVGHSSPRPSRKADAL